MYIRKYRSKDRFFFEYSITHLTQTEFDFLASIMANLRFDIPYSSKVGRFTLDYNGYTSVARADHSDALDALRKNFACYASVRDNLTPQTEIKFDIDDVL